MRCNVARRQAYGIQSTSDEVSPRGAGIRSRDQPAAARPAGRHLSLATAGAPGRRTPSIQAQTHDLCESTGYFEHASPGQNRSSRARARGPGRGSLTPHIHLSCPTDRRWYDGFCGRRLRPFLRQCLTPEAPFLTIARLPAVKDWPPLRRTTPLQNPCLGATPSVASERVPRRP